MTSIKNRTSIRKYSTKEVSDELLNQLLEDAMRTPTMGNLQLYSIVITRSEEGKKALAPAHFNQPMVTGAPLYSPSVPIIVAPPYGQRTARELLATITFSPS